MPGQLLAGLANRRNGSSPKTVIGSEGFLEPPLPLDRHDRSRAALIVKYHRRLSGFDDRIIALYAHGMSAPDIHGHVCELNGIEVSPDLVSAVADQVIDEATAWQPRPHEPSYAIVSEKIHDEGLVCIKAVHFAISMDASGCKQVLVLWIEQTEGDKFWLRVTYEIKSRGTQDVLIAVVDGPKEFARPLQR